MKLENEKFFVFGYFGYKTNQLNGQIVRTRNVYKLLKCYVKNENLDYADTQVIRKNPISLLGALWSIIKSDYLFFIPAHNSLKQIFPIIFFLSLIFRFKIIYIAIGGWLDQFLYEYPILSRFLSKICVIGVQNKKLVNSLQEKFNFKNVVLFPNFRFSDYQPDFLYKSSALAIVFMARVDREKGLDIVFNVAERIEQRYGSDDISITFYGPINQKDSDYFYENLNKHKCVTYRGVLQPNEITETLAKYDVMIFPTSYPGEGFPGTVLDSYLAGIPVIASDWLYNSEIIKNGETGYICDLKYPIQFFERITDLYEDRNLLLNMKKAAFAESKKYSPKVAWDIISPYLK